MTTVVRTIIAVVAGAAVAPAPFRAEAQGRDWEREVAPRIERQAERMAGALAHIAGDVAAGIPAGGQARGDRDRRGRGGAEYTEEISQTHRLGRDGTVELSTVSGSIRVTGTGGDEVRLTAVKRVRHPSEQEARRLLRDTEVIVSTRGGNVEVRTDYRGRGGFWGAASVDYTVSMPRGGHLTVRSVSGDILITGVRGEVRAESVSGSITARDVGRVRQVKTLSGSIELADARGEELSGSTVSGSATIRNVNLRSVDFGTVSGRLTFTDVEAARASIRSVSGAIDYAGRLSPAGRYELRSHSGAIRVTPAAGTAVTLEAATFSGNVRSDFPATLRALRAGPRRSLSGTIGGSRDSGAVLSIQSFSGDIIVAR